MSTDFEERLEAAAAFVASVAGTAMFMEESRKQKEKVVSMLTATSVSHGMIPRYLRAVQAGGFAEGHLLEIRAALEAAAERLLREGGYSTCGAAQQNFQSFCAFFKASQWARLRAQGGEDPLRLLVFFGCSWLPQRQRAHVLPRRHRAAVVQRVHGRTSRHVQRHLQARVRCGEEGR